MELLNLLQRHRHQVGYLEDPVGVEDVQVTEDVDLVVVRAVEFQDLPSGIIHLPPTTVVVQLQGEPQL